MPSSMARQRSKLRMRSPSALRGRAFSSSVSSARRVASNSEIFWARWISAQGAQRRFAQPAARRVVDALEGQVVVGLHGDAAIGQRVADLLALVEARPADHPVGQAHGDEAFLELARLEAGAHQDGDLAQRVLVALQRLDLLADRARLLVAVPHAAQRDALALLDLGPQRLAEPSLVVGDQVRGGGQDVRGRAVVALQPDDGGARKILLEAQDVADLGAAPAVDRLVVVADAADVLRCPAPAAAATDTAPRWCPGTRRPGCGGSGGGISPARRGASATASRSAGRGRRNRRRSPRRAAPDIGGRCRRRGRWRTRRHRRPRPCPASARGPSSAG